MRIFSLSSGEKRSADSVDSQLKIPSGIAINFSSGIMFAGGYFFITYLVTVFELFASLKTCLGVPTSSTEDAVMSSRPSLYL